MSRKTNHLRKRLRVHEECRGHEMDAIRETVIARAAELNLSAYAVAKLTGGKVSQSHIRAFMNRKKSMGSEKLQHVLKALRLRIDKSTID